MLIGRTLWGVALDNLHFHPNDHLFAAVCCHSFHPPSPRTQLGLMPFYLRNSHLPRVRVVQLRVRVSVTRFRRGTRFDQSLATCHIGNRRSEGTMG